ncbi:MAG: cyclase family protein [Candidatus Obscuribacterales bacterium]|nr:cyclase family protein [Candidatus Obscuribacterales bacterium]
MRINSKITCLLLALLLTNISAQAKEQANKIVDLTHTISADIPNYRNDRDAFQYTTVATVNKDGYGYGTFQMPEHYGTHIDAPCHFLAGATSIDQLPTANLFVPCVVIDVRKEVERNQDYSLSLEKIKEFEKKGLIPAHSAVLLLTGWSQRWHNPQAYRNADSQGHLHFPGYSHEAAEFLAEKRQAAYLGIDTLSLDPGNTSQFPVHSHILTKGVYLIENLACLDKLPARGAKLFCGALPIKNGTGSPARIVAVLP